MAHYARDLPNCKLTLLTAPLSYEISKVCRNAVLDALDALAGHAITSPNVSHCFQMNEERILGARFLASVGNSSKCLDNDLIEVIA